MAVRNKMNVCLAIIGICSLLCISPVTMSFDVRGTSNPVDSRVIEHTNPKSIVVMYQMMKDTHDIFNYYGITYWAAAGTLLGAVRHKGIIPWDYDLDIFMFEEDEQQLLALEPIFRKLGYTLKRKREYVYNIISHKRRGCHIDIIFAYHDKEQDKIFYSCKHLQKRFRREKLPLHFTTSELYPLRTVSFGSFHITVPSEPHLYLRYAYGVDYRTHVKAKSKHVPLRDEDRTPAKPLGPLKNNISRIAS